MRLGSESQFVYSAKEKNMPYLYMREYIMREFSTKAYAKINLGLDVVRKRDDGYHELRTIMQSINLYDTIYIKTIKDDKIILQTDKNFLPTDERNIAYKAAALMKEKYSIKEGVFIDIQKNIPVAAGMAGGSTDAAATLYGMSKLFELSVTPEELMKLGTGLGADVPYCIMKGTALAEGIGEILTRVSPMPECYVLTVKPEVNVSTKQVYEDLHLNECIRHPDIDGLLRELEKGNLEGVCSKFGNVLETVTEKQHPIISEYKRKMLEYGAINSMMSGSGPSVFGIFKTREGASEAQRKILSKLTDIRVQSNVSCIHNVK